MALTIDELEIKIESDASKAIGGIDSLAASLGSLKSALGGSSGLTSNLSQIATAMNELKSVGNINMSSNISQLSQLKSGFSALPSQIKNATSSVSKVSTANQKASKSYGGLSDSLYAAAKKFMVLYYAASKIIDVFAECFNESNNYIENMNLFRVTMGDATDAALSFATKVNDIMGIDISDWAKNQGVFMQLSTGFGVASEQATVMSQNLTQLAYDMSSFFNTDVETAMQKLQSGMSGQIKGLKAFGINLSVAALQETALSLGIEKSVRQMTEAERAQLRYITVMQKSQNIMGDMARTLETPANATRILSSQMTQLKRAIGDIASIIITKLLPVIKEFVSMTTDAANALAKLLGFKLPEIDYSGLELGSDIADDMDESLEGTEETIKELKKQLAGFDEINILKNESSQDSQETSFDLGIDMPEYDFLGGLESEYSDLSQKIKEVAIRLAESFNTLDFTEALNRVKEFLKNVTEQFKGIDFGGALVDVWDGAVAALGSVVNLIVQTFAPLFESLNVPQIVFASLEVFASVFKTLSKIVRSATKFLSGFIEKGLSPIVEWISGAVVSAFEKWRDISDKVGAWFEDAEPLFESFGSALGEIVASVWDFLEPFASAVFDGALSLLEDIADALLSVAGCALELADVVAVDLKSAFEGLKQVLEPVSNFLEGAIGYVFENVLSPALKYFSGTVVPGVTSTLKNLWNNVIVPFGNFLASYFSPAIQILSDLLGYLWKYVVLPLADAVGGVFKARFESWSTIMNKTVIPVLSKAIGFFRELWENVFKPIANFLWSVFSPAFEEVFRGISGFIGGLKASLKGIIDFITGVFTADWALAWGGIKSTFTGIWDAIEAPLKGTLNGWIILFEGLANKIVDAWNWVKQSINSMSFDLPDWMGKLVGGTRVGFNLEMSKHISIPRFEDGGFPNAGSLFWANEGGFPELVGRIGNKTAVANNDQITAGIASAVYEAMMAAQADGANGNRGTARIVVQIGERAVGEASVEYINGQIRQTGTNPIIY